MSLISEYSNWFKWISDSEILPFIVQHADRNTSSLAFELSDYPIDKRNFILNQISSRQSAQNKIPEYASFEHIIYPAKQSLEQSSSAITARYKSSLFRGEKFLDLTAGFGVDSFYFSKNFKSIQLVEKSNFLVDLLKYNFKVLKIQNASYHCNDALTFLKNMNHRVDLIYIDPSRRKGDKRLLDIRDYDPNIVEISTELKEKAADVLIKLSPVTDLRQIVRLIPTISSLTVVSVKNECKEILVRLSDNSPFSFNVLTIDLNEKSNRSYTFNLNDENNIELIYTDVKKFIYLPMTAAVKAGAFKSISRDFKVGKLSGNTHIYTSSEFIDDFPGKAFECLGSTAFNQKSLRKLFSDISFSIVCRNFPMKPEQVAKKLGISEDGKLHLIAYRNRSEKLQISVARQIIV